MKIKKYFISQYFLKRDYVSSDHYEIFFEYGKESQFEQFCLLSISVKRYKWKNRFRISESDIYWSSANPLQSHTQTCSQFHLNTNVWMHKHSQNSINLEREPSKNLFDSIIALSIYISIQLVHYAHNLLPAFCNEINVLEWAIGWNLWIREYLIKNEVVGFVLGGPG